MLKLHTQRHIEFTIVEKATFFAVYALFLETTGDQTVEVREPKLVRIIRKVAPVIALPSPFATDAAPVAVVSPYAAPIRSQEPNHLAWYFARPPTRA